jgi:hypothetical protein
LVPKREISQNYTANAPVPKIVISLKKSLIDLINLIELPNDDYGAV